MYQTARSNRVFWGTKRKQLQKENRALNIKKIINQDLLIINKGWKKNNLIHMLFRISAIERFKRLNNE